MWLKGPDDARLTNDIADIRLDGIGLELVLCLVQSLSINPINMLRRHWRDLVFTFPTDTVCTWTALVEDEAAALAEDVEDGAVSLDTDCEYPIRADIAKQRIVAMNSILIQNVWSKRRLRLRLSMEGFLEEKRERKKKIPRLSTSNGRLV